MKTRLNKEKGKFPNPTMDDIPEPEDTVGGGVSADGPAIATAVCTGLFGRRQS